MRTTVKYKVITATLSAALLFGSAAALPAPIANAAQSAEVIWGINMRTGPSTSDSVIRMLKKGEQITVLEETNGWYKVSDSSGTTGYISASTKYTELGAELANGSGSDTEALATLTGVVKKSVSFRNGPGTSYDRIRYLKKGEEVQVVSQPSSGWYEIIDSKGVKGYVSSQTQYISVDGTISSGSDNSESAGSGSTGETTEDTGSSSGATNASVEKVITVGMKYLGTPYEFGSNRSTTTTFDCSDLMKQMFKEALGVTLPADSRQQGTYVKNKGNAVTSISQLKRGDLMFFMSYKGSSKSSYSGIDKSSQRITHVGIYLGDGKILHTYSKESGGVRTNDIMGTAWEYRFLYGGSAL
ncbi:SH3 domain-containing protein [Paenibacillus sp. LHD-117]|uniref:C40 family peptidase n=1 Tax=Paenibacillus sp. LHD-117 TaxID=3071412 RepID=UPI0027DED7E5|nr:SH3 domain-containing protein [Paenibacillus sp. LHD-117]MDQ6421171.1 SH3 domain-containing protein [Paenibacillus sp. LHD-117]